MLQKFGELARALIYFFLCSFCQCVAIMEFDLPGFRFHPTEEELLGFYLTKTVLGTQIHSDIIGFLDIYLHEPWDLPRLAKIGEREWYFFVPRESKNGHGSRPSRTTEMGYWKATGSDRAIRCLTEPRKLLGHRKTMVFYHGRAPRGCKTDWVMNEYRLPTRSFSLAKEIVLCKVYRKATSLKVLEQRAAIEENTRAASTITFSSPLQTQDRFSSYEQQKKFNDLLFWQGDNTTIVHKVEEEVAAVDEEDKNAMYSSQMVGVGPVSDQIQLPNFILDWTMDPLWP